MMTDIPRRWARDAEDDLLPANEVSWLDAIAFCNALSERQGLTACYQMDNNTVTWNHRADGYRLPTEAEWEYAVRAGTETRWFCGEEPTALARYAWFDESVSGRVHPVGGKAPNPWGLYDMVGNVWEWCWDWYGDYAVAGVSDPTGPDHGTSRVQRGGAFGYGARRLRSAYRYSYEPEDRHDAIGFRVVRRPRRPL
jgi:formylglycine-generating enzyme required for sulfatase activity